VRRPEVSVLLPVRNEQQHLPAALSSLQRQTLTDWELIAVDDGSTDATAEILRRAAEQDARIRVFSQPAHGLVAALNFGLERCTASLVARMDGDDIAHPARLALQLASLQHDPELSLVASRVRHFPRPQLRGGMLHYERWQNSLLSHAEIIRNLYVESPFAHPSVMFRKQAVMAAGGYRQQGWAEDYDLWLRLAQQGARFSRRPETLLFWRDRPERLTRTADTCSLAAFRRCKINFLIEDFLHGETQVTLWGVGPEGKAWRKLLAARGIHVSTWIDVDRNKIGQSIHGAPVLAPEAVNNRRGKMLVTVGAKRARQLIRDWCRNKGLTETVDYFCVS
jgi:glycosyltransferase involved in cell wall biosynthesis